MKHLFDKEIIRIKKYSWGLIIIWVSIILISLGWSLISEYYHIDNLVINDARSHFNKDQAIRMWATNHGGVYVPKNDRTPPNEYLSYIIDREIVRPNGDTLTLMNPAYIIRQMFDEYPKEYGVKGRIVSLKPLNPNNFPDEWEQKALKHFELEAKEFYEFINIKGEKYLRFISPMVTEEGCLTCHGFQGYKVGDVRGGVGVSILMEPYYNNAIVHFYSIISLHLLMLFIGLIAIYSGSKRIIRKNIEKDKIALKLNKNESRFKEFTDSITDIFFVLDNNLKYVFWNRVCENKYGLPTEEVLGKSWYDLELNRGYEWIADKYKNIIKSKLTETFEVKYEKSGLNYLRINAYPTSDGLVIYAQDITDFRFAENALMESEKQLSLIFNNANDFILLIKVNTNNNYEIVTCNQKFIDYKKTLGIKFDREDVVGKNLVIFLRDISKADKTITEFILNQYNTAVASGKIVKYEEETAINKTTYVTETTLTPIFNNSGQCVNLLCVSRDISTQKEAQRRLKKSEEKFRKYFELGLVGMGIFDPQKGWIEFNRTLHQMLGYTREEFLYTHWDDFTYKNDMENDLVPYNTLLDSQIDSYSIEKRFLHKDGRIVETVISSSVMKKDNGEVDYFVALVHDISELKHSEMKLKESEFRYRTVADFTYSWELWLDHSNSLIYVSPACETISGYSVKEFITDPDLFDRIVHPGSKELWDFHKQQSCNQICENREIELRIIRKDGITIWINHICRPVISDSKEFLGYRATNRDINTQKEYANNLQKVLKENQQKISELQDLNKRIEDEQNAALNLMEDLSEEIREREKTEKELALHKENLEKLVYQRTEEIRSINKQLSLEIENKIKAEDKVKQSLLKEQQVNELKTRFISTVSHEIRTPLTAIKSSVDLLEIYSYKKSFEKQGEHLERINKSIDYLVSLVEDVLTASKADTGQIEFKPENIKIESLVKDIISQMEYLDNNLHKINVNSDKGYIHIDPKLIRLIINNLISNALKYSPENSDVNVQIKLSNELIIIVQDNGIGVPKESLELLFEPFYRAVNSEKYKGSGLGLSIIKKIIDMMQGKIEVESELGEGSKFTVTIPNITSVQNYIIEKSERE